jgi:hypothetical protein
MLAGHQMQEDETAADAPFAAQIATAQEAEQRVAQRLKDIDQQRRVVVLELEYARKNLVLLQEMQRRALFGGSAGADDCDGRGSEGAKSEGAKSEGAAGDAGGEPANGHPADLTDPSTCDDDDATLPLRKRSRQESAAAEQCAAPPAHAKSSAPGAADDGLRSKGLATDAELNTPSKVTQPEPAQPPPQQPSRARPGTADSTVHVAGTQYYTPLCTQETAAMPASEPGPAIRNTPVDRQLVRERARSVRQRLLASAGGLIELPIRLHADTAQVPHVTPHALTARFQLLSDAKTICYDVGVTMCEGSEPEYITARNAELRLHFIPNPNKKAAVEHIFQYEGCCLKAVCHASQLNAKVRSKAIEDSLSSRTCNPAPAGASDDPAPPVQGAVPAPVEPAAKAGKETLGGEV